MPSVHQCLVYVILLLFALIQLGSCLLCYACTEKEGGICRAHDGTQRGMQVCGNSKVCVKHTLVPAYWEPGQVKEVTERFCADEGYCNLGLYMMVEHKRKLKTRRCITCKRNRCNSAMSLEISSITITILSTKYYFL